MRVFTCEFTRRPADDQIGDEQARGENRRESQQHEHRVPVIEPIARVVIRAAEQRDAQMLELREPMDDFSHLTSKSALQRSMTV